jgi:hypothetical protein
LKEWRTDGADFPDFKRGKCRMQDLLARWAVFAGTIRVRLDFLDN